MAWRSHDERGGGQCFAAAHFEAVVDFLVVAHGGNAFLHFNVRVSEGLPRRRCFSHRDPALLGGFLAANKVVGARPRPALLLDLPAAGLRGHRLLYHCVQESGLRMQKLFIIVHEAARLR